MIRALLLESRVPQSFWPEAVSTSVYLLNRLPTRTLQLQTPLSLLSSVTTVPSALSLPPRVFGCSVFVHIPKHERTKFSPCALKCVFVGYGINQKGYRCFDPKTRRILTTMNCDFIETEYFYHTQLSSQGERSEVDLPSWLPMPNPLPMVVPQEPISTGAEPSNTPIQPVDNGATSLPQLVSEVNSPEPNTIDPLHTTDNASEGEEQETALDDDTGQYVLPPRSTRGVPPKRYSPERIGRNSRYSVANVTRTSLSKTACAFESALYAEEDIPRSVESAIKIKHWRKAMEVEMNALARNNTWEKCHLPEGKKPVGCRWVFTIKRKPDGTIERYKARLVAKGYKQVYGVHKHSPL